MNVKILACAFILCSFISGCGAARPSNYYQLTVPQDLVPSGRPDPYPVTLMIGPITSSELYRQDHIVYTDRGESMGMYQYHRWAEPPTEMIAEVLLRALRSSGHLQSVYMWGSDVHGDYLLRGRLYDFREVSATPLMGRVTLELELRNTRTGATVWTHVYSHDEPVAGKDVSAVVAALDRNTQRGIGEFIASLDQYFSTHPPASVSPSR